MSDSKTPGEPPDLRAELARAAAKTNLAERTLEVVSVIEAVAAPLGIHPVIVGGMAVYSRLLPAMPGWVDAPAR